MACSRNRLCLFPFLYLSERWPETRCRHPPLLSFRFCFFAFFLGHSAYPRLTVLGVLHATYPTVTEAVLKALSLCENLYSFTWVDDTSALPTVFLSFLKILRDLPLRALTLRTYSDPGEDAWAFLNTMPDLQKVAIWCMNGPPRVLQGWAPLLGSTLTELELGVRTDRTDRGSVNDSLYLYSSDAPASPRPF
jgi:hypothetical protein